MIHIHYATPLRLRFRLTMPPVLRGVGLCFLITSAAYAIEACETAMFGKAWLEALVLAILIGTAVRSLWSPGPSWRSGISFSAKYLLEIAVVLLGISVSATMIASAGPTLLCGIAVLVTVAILLSFAIGKMLRLPTRMALLVSCGNAICGNSAIAAVAPVIGANGEDVASSIAFTAVLGVVVVLGLPIFGLAMGLSGAAYGVFAGLTVYAVPQVIAAAAPMGTVAVQMGTLVKLVRVLMLSPVCVVLSLIAPRLAPSIKSAGALINNETPLRRRPSLPNLVPWFIIGFLAMVACRSLGMVPIGVVAPVGHLATLLTVVSMAALGLGVDMRTVAHAGGKVTITVLLSLLALGTISLALLWVLNML